MYNDEQIFQSLAAQLKQAFDDALHENEIKRSNAEQFIISCKQDPNNYTLMLLHILHTHSTSSSPTTINNCFVQLKNIILSSYISLSFPTQKHLQSSIIHLFIKAKDVFEVKTCKIIINHIIQNLTSKELWQEYTNAISILLNSNNKTNLYSIYCGMTLIYFISLKHEYNLERSEYNLMFNSFNPLLFDYFTYLYGLSINEGNIILITKCICVILKILIKSIAIEPPIAFINTINDYLQFYYKNINNIKHNKIDKYISWLFYILYQRYSDFKNGKEGQEYIEQFSLMLKSNHIHNFFEFYLSQCKSIIPNYDNNIINKEQERILHFAYNFYTLILNRKDENLYQLLNTNIIQIITNSIYHNILTQNTLQLSQKDYIYDLVDQTNDIKKALCDFLKKIGTKTELSVLIIENIIEFLNLNSNNKHLLESSLYIIGIIFKHTHQKQELFTHYKTIITKYISNNLTFTSNPLPMIDNALYITQIDLLANEKYTNKFTQNEITFLLNNLYNGITIQNNICIKMICAFTIPTLLHNYNEIKNEFASKTPELFVTYINLLKEIEIENCVWGLEKVITLYPRETLQYIIDIIKELINIFYSYITELKEEIKQNEISDIDSVASEILGIITSLFNVAYKNNYTQFNDMVILCNDLISFCISDDCANISMIIYEKGISLLNVILEFVNFETLNNILFSYIWKYYHLLIEAIVNQIPKGSGVYFEGKGFDLLQKITPCIYTYIVRANSDFINNNLLLSVICFKKGIELCHIRNDEVFCCCFIKLFISLFEMNYNTNNNNSTVIPDSILNEIILLIINEIQIAKNQFYLVYIFQLWAVMLTYNAKLCLQLIDNYKMSDNIFKKWIDLLNIMKYDFEIKRNVIGLVSLFKVPKKCLLCNIVNGFGFICDKVCEMVSKYGNVVKNKDSEKECDVSGEDLDEESEYSDACFSSESEFYEDDEDEYTCETDIVNNKLKTMFERDNMYRIIWNVFLEINNNDEKEWDGKGEKQMEFIVSGFGKDKFDMFVAFLKKELNMV